MSQTQRFLFYPCSVTRLWALMPSCAGSLANTCMRHPDLIPQHYPKGILIQLPASTHQTPPDKSPTQAAHLKKAFKALEPHFFLGSWPCFPIQADSSCKEKSFPTHMQDASAIPGVKSIP